MKECAALIVEDEEHLQHLLTTIVRRHCSPVHVAGDGEQAIEMLRSGTYDVVLLDLMLPKVNGFAVSEVIQQMPIRPRVIVLSAISRYFTDRFPAETVVLQKPFDVDRLEEVIRTTA